MGLGVVFFFQAEDGIRDGRVTGVQTCALPIFALRRLQGERLRAGQRRGGDRRLPADEEQIGRASCRERVEISGVAVSLKKKKTKTTKGGGTQLIMSQSREKAGNQPTTELADRG